MPSNKDRLYVGLYARGGTVKMPGGEDKYHWALLVRPKGEDGDTRGKRFHAKERIYSGTQSVWEFSEQETGTASTLMILVRIQIAKVKSLKKLEASLRSEALSTLQSNNKALGTAVLDWTTARDTAMWYVEQKALQHRFDGQAAPGQFDTSRVSTYSLLQGKELVP
ncbi:uncharacterized protein FMAN_16168 [Fusarium mangiferae]|uniref:Uncharacterized protein n=1 Tax=Fusarium mangiferae TaxID=192010 RepID=A0A1L7TTF5_FUSMA|nr:uncharacterized protein FMAN_16168 [Fusarium mangiferae]CVK98617.1 uncharacterized protein FMAN_16168 [Fusarium mangiferae]